MINLFELNLLDESACQLSMDYWDGCLDPNQRHSDTCKLKSDDLRAAMSFLALPSRASSDVTLCIFSDAIELHVSANGGECFATARIQLLEKSALSQPFAVLTNREILTNVSKHFVGECVFAFPPDRSEFSWIQETWSGSIPTHLTAMPESVNVSPDAIACSGGEIAKGLGFANCLKPKYVAPTATTPHGSRIYDGKIMGGSSYAVAEYSSPEIPKALNVPIPHTAITNVCHLLRQMKSCVGGATPDKVIFSNQQLGFKAGWLTRAANWPEMLFTVFERHTSVFTGIIEPWHFANRATLLTIPVYKQRIALGYLTVAKDQPNEDNVFLVSEYPNGVGRIPVGLAWPNDHDPSYLRKNNYRLHDIATGIYALSPDPVTLSISDGAMLLEQRVEDGVCCKILFSAGLRH